MGANVEEREDGFSVAGGQSLHGAEVDSMGDHRIAMAFGIAALRASGDTLIHNSMRAKFRSLGSSGSRGCCQILITKVV